ncbi:hypothetical protein [Blastococcus capsensis]|uniref:hypothetical protein n=1 Tax=Blastococcus capsensis TaxID=1564163 RepID=UPI0025415053|nr:hypothetical protein [Blastococcus capsensis]MDK3258352.1 hypothetical protein [Blastococcus capsensis]
MTEVATPEAVQPEPPEREPGIRVEVALLLVEHLVEQVVDLLQRLADGHGLAVVAQHGGVASEHGHARSDRRLRQVDRRDGPLLQLPERLGQLRAERGEEPAPVRGRRIRRPWPEREHDGRRQRIAVDAAHAIPQFAAHGPGGCDRPAGVDHRPE